MRLRRPLSSVNIQRGRLSMRLARHSGCLQQQFRPSFGNPENDQRGLGFWRVGPRILEAARASEIGGVDGRRRALCGEYRVWFADSVLFRLPIQSWVVCRPRPPLLIIDMGEERTIRQKRGMF